MTSPGFRLRLLGLGAVLALWAGMVLSSARAQQDDLVQRGNYLATISNCKDCHTPTQADSLTLNRSLELAGGRPFDLGPAGIVYSKNLTSDPETGLGRWSDEEIKTAIRTGRSRDGLHLFPIMPYVIYNNMAEADLDAIVAYLRTIKPIRNAVPRTQILPPELLPQLEVKAGGVAPPDSDTAARGRYLMTAVIACTDCHTPINAETGAPIAEKYLAGGLPFAGPWGTVYSANITPDQTSGIGTWSDEEVRRVLHTGVRPDGRRVVLMPWEDYQALTDADLNAVVAYLRNDVPAVVNAVPAADLKPEFISRVPVETARPASSPSWPLIAGIGALVVLGGIALVAMRRRGQPAA